MNDTELLHDYAQRGSREAFDQLVTRHLPVVYGAARRQVRSPDLANEVAQTVFLELASAARRLRPDTCLASWLYVATRRKAIDVIRKEATRARHEEAAAVMNESTNPVLWADIEPLLDAAMDSLGPDDRRVILLRFFENRTLAHVGQALKCSEDAAQKRVTRALERLKDFLARRGVRTVASALAADLAAFAAPPAPVGLGKTIAGVLPSGPAAAVVAREFLPALQNLVGIAACAGALGFAGYEGWTWHRQRTDLRNLVAVAGRWEAAATVVQAERDRLRVETSRTNTAAAAISPVSADTEFDERIRSVLARVAQVKQRFIQNPAVTIPELALLSDSDWIAVVQEQRAWGTEEDWRQSLANIRTRAKNRATSPMQMALRQYVKENSGMLPGEVAQIAPYLRNPTFDPAIFSRYEMAATGASDNLSRDEIAIRERKSGVIDAKYDNLGILGLTMLGVRAAELFPGAPDAAELETATEVALKTYRAAHGSKDPGPSDPEVLAPYFSDPDKAASFLHQATLRVNRFEFSEPNAAGHAMNLYHAANHGQYAPTPKELAPYFQNPADAARYLLAAQGQLNP